MPATTRASSRSHRAETHDAEVPISVAVVGTGLAGLTTAYLLNNDVEERYKVTLFEQVFDI